MRKRKDDVVTMLRALPASLIEQTKVLELVPGEATFTAPKAVEVRLNTGDTRILNAETIVIDTGARPFTPPIPGLESVPRTRLDEPPDGATARASGWCPLR